MRHFFILGSHPALSVAEIIALLGDGFTVVEVAPLVLIVESGEGVKFDARTLMARIGGTIKIGSLEMSDVAMNDDVAGMVEEYVFNTLRQNTGGATFGISIYGMDGEHAIDKAAMAVGKLKNVGMTVKKRIKKTGSPARWVEVQAGTALTSVAVGKNEMLEKGGEFVVLVKSGKMSFGRTGAIQPFEEFSLVDYGRPERDTKQGMLPPKLARMMINIAVDARVPSETVIADPYCGSGTVLTEALQMGFREMYGSDKNPAAIEATTKNIAWLVEKKLVSESSGAKVFMSDARQLGQQIGEEALDSVVTELYLGPVRNGHETRGQLQKSLDDLTKLYVESLLNWRKLLKPDATVVLAMPVYVMGTERHGISLMEVEKLGYVTESLCDKSVLSRLGVAETKNKGILYGRSNQLVWREIVRLRLAAPLEDVPLTDLTTFDEPPPAWNN